MVDIMKAAGTEAGLDITTTSEQQPLPPASLQSFLKKRNISGLVVTDHEKSFTNKWVCLDPVLEVLLNGWLTGGRCVVIYGGV